MTGTQTEIGETRPKATWDLKHEAKPKQPMDRGDTLANPKASENPFASHLVVTDDPSSAFLSTIRLVLPKEFVRLRALSLEHVPPESTSHICYVTECVDPQTLVNHLLSLRRPGRSITLVTPLLSHLGVGRKLSPGVRSWRLRDPSRARSTWAKRSLDLTLSGLAIACLLPLMSLVALTVRFTSRGPALFRQQRLGQNRVPFAFLKFRSMVTDNDDQLHRDYLKRFINGAASKDESDHNLFKVTSDPRVTPVGSLIRKASIDELPQLFNVFKGQMSLVGPRPALPYEAADYSPWHQCRFDSPAGITGLWQVYGRSRVPFDQAVFLDLLYVWGGSFTLDISLLWRTIPAVLAGRGGF